MINGRYLQFRQNCNISSVYQNCLSNISRRSSVIMSKLHKTCVFFFFVTSRWRRIALFFIYTEYPIGISLLDLYMTLIIGKFDEKKYEFLLTFLFLFFFFYLLFITYFRLSSKFSFQYDILYRKNSIEYRYLIQYLARATNRALSKKVRKVEIS